MPEFSGLKSGWLKGRKGSVEGWFPVDFVMPVLVEKSELRRRADDVTTECSQSADHSNYTNLPPQYVRHFCHKNAYFVFFEYTHTHTHTRLTALFPGLPR